MKNSKLYLVDWARFGASKLDQVIFELPRNWSEEKCWEAISGQAKTKGMQAWNMKRIGRIYKEQSFSTLFTLKCSQTVATSKRLTAALLESLKVGRIQS
jgi:hypothetical protein